MEIDNKTNNTQAAGGALKDGELFRALADRAQVGIYITDASGNYEYVNQFWCDTAGFSLKEALGAGWTKAIYSEDRSAFLEQWSKAIAAGEGWRGEYRFQLPNGKITWVYGLVDPERDASGKVVHYAGMNVDITQRKEAEEQLRQSTDKYEALFISSRDAVMTLEPPSWKFTTANPATIAMFGAKDEKDFLHYPPWELSPKLQADGINSMGKAMEMIDEAMLKGANLFEWTHKRVNGEDFPAEVLLSKVEQGGKTYLHAVVRDITERKKLEAEIIHTAEEKFKIFFDNANDGMLLADRETKKFQLGNKAICEMLGYSFDEIKNLFVADIHPSEHLSMVMEQFEKQAKGEIKIARELPVMKKGGSVFYADINASTVKIGNKEYLLGIFRDVTEQKHAEEKLKENTEMLKESQLTAQLGSYILDVHTGFWTSSDGLDVVFGIDEGFKRDVEGWLMLVHAEDRAMMGDYFKNEVLGQSKPFNKEYRIVRSSDGAVRWVHGLGNLKGAGPGLPVEMRGTIQDITEHKMEDRVLEERLNEIEKLNKLMIGRELKMAELKKELIALKTKE